MGGRIEKRSEKGQEGERGEGRGATPSSPATQTCEGDQPHQDSYYQKEVKKRISQYGREGSRAAGGGRTKCDV